MGHGQITCTNYICLCVYCFSLIVITMFRGRLYVGLDVFSVLTSALVDFMYSTADDLILQCDMPARHCLNLTTKCITNSSYGNLEQNKYNY